MKFMSDGLVGRSSSIIGAHSPTIVYASSRSSGIDRTARRGGNGARANSGLPVSR